MLDPFREELVPLRSGRTVGVAEFGAPGGDPVLWFHGIPGARRQVPPDAPAAAVSRGMRIIGVERPGAGDSTPHLFSSLVEWADDVGEVVDRLRVEHFGVAGLSGGGPYALACAYRFPDRVVAAAVLGGVAPVCGDEAVGGGFGDLTRFIERLSPLLFAVNGPLAVALRLFRGPLRLLASPAYDLFVRYGPQGDRRTFARPDIKAMLLDDMIVGGMKQGLRAALHDVVLLARDWGFSLRDIRVPVRFWQGDADDFVPLEHGRHMAALVPHAELIPCPGEGHFAGFTAVEDVLDGIRAHFAAVRRRVPDGEP